MRACVRACVRGAGDPFVISASFAGALQFARDWGELTHETPESLTVRHDVESPWFGLMFWSVIWDEGARGYSWMRPGWRDQPHETPEQLQTLRATYFEPILSNTTDPHRLAPADVHENSWSITPTGTAMKWLARCGVDGAVAVHVTPSSDRGWTNRISEYRKSGAAVFACKHSAGTLAVTLVNTDPVPHQIELAWSGGVLPKQSVPLTTMAAAGSLPIASRLSARAPAVVLENVTVGGGGDNGVAGAVVARWVMPAYSLQRCDIELN